jgi:ubiquitin-conjugating enzyme E2 S
LTAQLISPKPYQAEIEGPEQTPYHAHYFQLKLVISTDFPNTPPRGYFLTKIYHPNVDPQTGAICVNTLKKDWTPATSLSHVLTVIRCLLIVPFPESSLNDEAGKNFMESYDEYARRAKLLAGVHGLKGWSTPVENANGVEQENNEEKDDEDVKMPAGTVSVPNALGKNGSRSNIVKSGGVNKSLEKKMSKKKSLKRL